MQDEEQYLNTPQNVWYISDPTTANLFLIQIRATGIVKYRVKREDYFYEFKIDGTTNQLTNLKKAWQHRLNFIDPINIVEYTLAQQDTQEAPQEGKSIKYGFESVRRCFDSELYIGVSGYKELNQMVDRKVRYDHDF